MDMENAECSRIEGLRAQDQPAFFDLNDTCK